MLLLELELRGVLDRDDPLRVRDEGGHCVQGRRLTGAGTARDQDVQLAVDAGGEKLSGLRRERSEVDQVVHRVGVTRELPDRQRRTAQRQGRNNRVHARAVR